MYKNYQGGEMTKEQRVRQLMDKHGLDAVDDLLVAKILIIYLEAQIDQLKEDK
jgi:hypothetical protein